MAFDIEVIFIALWALVFDDVLIGGFVGMLVFVGIMELSVLVRRQEGPADVEVNEQGKAAGQGRA